MVVEIKSTSAASLIPLEALQLRAREDLLALAEHSAGIGVWDVDLATGTVRGTAQFFRIMGLEPADGPVPIDRLRAMRHPDDRERVVEGFHEAVRSGADAYEIEYRIIRPDGATRWIFGRGRVVRDENGTPVRYSGVDIDITERKAAEVALAESEERFRLAQEAAGIGTWDWHVRAGTMRWSARQWTLHGLAPKEAGPSYRGWLAAIHPDDRPGVDAAIEEAIAGKTAYEAEYRVIAPGGGVRWLSSRGTVISDEAGRPMRLLGVNADVTERREWAEALARLNQELETRVRQRTMELEAEAAKRAEAESRLHQAQKMEAIGQLTGGVAHDFNNLLTVIFGSLETLLRRLAQDGVDPARLRRPAENALRGAQRAASLTQHLLAFSRRQPLDPKPLDVNRLVVGMSKLLARTLGEAISIETVLAADLWKTHIDANQLESAILNLAVNARDAMPGGGKLVIETANAHLDESHAAHQAEILPGQYVLVAVTDTGVGMSEEVVAHAFEPFFTTKEIGQGTGLGLSQVYGFVKQSGGHVKIHSGLGRGTSVKLFLPRLLAEVGEGEAEEPRAATLPAPRDGALQTVLVVEDDAPVRAHAAEILGELGYRVLEAFDAEGALALLDRDPAVRLLFTDVGLPGAMNGRKLAEEARRRLPRLKVLFTTAYARDAIVHDGRLDPDVQLISKPYTYGALAAKIREVLDAGGGPPCVLVVEDEALVRVAAVESLEDLGFRVEEAGSAREAIDKMRMRGGRFDAAIVDIGLPDGNGSDLARELRAMQADMPIVIATGYSEREVHERFGGDRRVAFLDKPYVAAELERVLRRLGLRAG